MRARKRHVQLTLEQARRPDDKHGGWRPNAGRKRIPGSISHATRAALNPRFPEHVTLRIAVEVGSIARDWLMPRMRECIRQAHRATFRIVEFNVLSNHVHLIVEAADKDALSRGIQGLAVRIARRMNSALKRKGRFGSGSRSVRGVRTVDAERHNVRRAIATREERPEAVEAIAFVHRA